MKTTPLRLFCLIVLLVTGCSAPTAKPAGAPTVPTHAPTSGIDPIIGFATTAPTSLPASETLANQPATLPAAPATSQTTVAPSATPIAATVVHGMPTAARESWQNLPVIPQVSDHVLEIYQRGQELGNNPRAFSKIGDCGSTPAWFLGDFDRGASFYSLGEYASLSEVIQQFQGSFDRTSLAARAGFNASALFVPIWADRSFCEANEGPLVCEYRVHKPVIAFIMLGVNDVFHPEEFEPQMRKIIEYSEQQGVIPILSTKADDKEGNGVINAAIARLALEYEVPLLNFYAAVEPLANHGLQADMSHLTWGRNLFDDPASMSAAWPWRNLTALQALEAVWLKIR